MGLGWGVRPPGTSGTGVWAISLQVAQAPRPLQAGSRQAEFGQDTKPGSPGRVCRRAGTHRPEKRAGVASRGSREARPTCCACQPVRVLAHCTRQCRLAWVSRLPGQVTSGDAGKTLKGPMAEGVPGKEPSLAEVARTHTGSLPCPNVATCPDLLQGGHSEGARRTRHIRQGWPALTCPPVGHD